MAQPAGEAPAAEAAAAQMAQPAGEAPAAEAAAAPLPKLEPMAVPKLDLPSMDDEIKFVGASLQVLTPLCALISSRRWFCHGFCHLAGSFLQGLLLTRFVLERMICMERADSILWRDDEAQQCVCAVAGPPRCSP